MKSVFFQPALASRRTPEHASLAVFGAALSELVIRPGGSASVGLWGAAYTDAPLEIIVNRNEKQVNKSPGALVKLNRTFHDPARHIQEFQISGLREGDTLVGVSASGRPQTDPLRVYELRKTPSGLMREASNTPSLLRWSLPGICPDATPYLSLSDPKMGGMAVLRDSTAGGPIQVVHGLAVHTTAGTEHRSAYLMTRWGCVEPWNTRGVSAHFGVAGDGTLVQFVPTTFVSYAQYSPGNEHWISVEVDNDGKSPMNARQLASVRTLFQWIVREYSIPRQLAIGCLFPKATHFDKITTEVCNRANVGTTTDAAMACMSYGVSCHWWLEANKTTNSHACPGPGILAQLDQIP